MEGATSDQGDTWQGWSLAMAAVSLAVMGLWLVAPRVTGAWLPVSYGLWALLGFGYLLLRTGRHQRRWADWVTAVRVALSVALFALFVRDPRPTWPRLGMAVLALVLDGVDGRLARYLGPTRHGAIFDMEADAFYVLTLCGIAHLYLGLGAWILVLPALRPCYVLALVVLQRFLPVQSPNRAGSFRGKLIHVVNISALLLVLAPLVPLAIKTAMAALATAMLCYSFGTDFYAALRPPRPSNP